MSKGKVSKETLQLKPEGCRWAPRREKRGSRKREGQRAPVSRTQKELRKLGALEKNLLSLEPKKWRETSEKWRRRNRQKPCPSGLLGSSILITQHWEAIYSDSIWVCFERISLCFCVKKEFGFHRYLIKKKNRWQGVLRLTFSLHNIKAGKSRETASMGMYRCVRNIGILASRISS